MGPISSCCKTEDDDQNQPLNSPQSPTLTRDHFEVIKIIGRGNFGKVCLVKKKGEEQFYAMKILKKSVIDSKKQKGHTLTERQVLENSTCPFIVKLYFAFQTSTKLYMVMEYMGGGELFFHLSKEGSFSEIRAKFYIGEILLGLNYLHSNGIIYRDLKPENILLDTDGHIRLTDFGLSKSGIDPNNPKAYTFCGTPEYLAPEILKNQGHGIAVDFWSLGAVMYYMLSGAPPFYSRNKNEIFKNVLTKPIERLANITEDGNNLFQSLLKIDPQERLTDFETIKSHMWFYGMDWNALSEKRINPPFKPKIRTKNDTRNFDKLFTQEPITDSIESELLSPSPNQYTGFTYQGSVPVSIQEI